MVESSLKSIMSAILSIGGPTGNAIKAESYGLSVRDYLGSTLQRLGIARAVNSTDAATYLDVKEKAVVIQFSFHGSTPPTAGTNTGNYGMCHTSGGAYTAGAIYYDDGTSIYAVTSYKGQIVLTTSSFTGSVSLGANGVYVAQTNTAPFTWTLKGDGAPASAGLEQAIQVAIGTSPSYNSSTSISAAAYITGVELDIQTGYSNGTSITVSIDGSTPLTVMLSSENAPTVVELYSKNLHSLVGALNAGPVEVAIAGGPVAGAGYCTVKFINTYLS